MAGNIQPVRVSAAGLFTFRLKKGSSVLLEEDYVPDSSGQAEIDIRDIILADLSLSLPDTDVYKQVSAVGSYTLTTDTDSKSFKAVLGGIDRPATDAATFLEANFLTWQPQIKSVAYNQPEWLSFYVWSTQTVLKARFYLKGGTTSDIVVAQGADFDPNCIYSVNVQFSRIWSLGTGDRYGMFDVWVEDGSGKVYTYTQRYVLDTSGDERTVLVARNSLGGIDTFSFLGSMERSAEAEHTNVMRGETMYSGLVDMTRTYTVNTGILSGHGRDWVWDLQRSPQAWVLMDGALRGIVMLAPAVTASMYEDSTGTVDFLLCDDSGYLNMPRMESLPEDIEVPGPDGEFFFLTPRLIEYPDASLEDSWLIPLQSGFEEKWYKASLGGIRNYVAGYLEDTYGKLWHGHDNLAVLNKFGIDASGALTWSGNPVGSGVDAGAFVTLATEQTITGKKTFSADAVFATKLYVPSSAGAGVYDIFIDDTGAVSGETPSAGGGLDEDELWSILSAQTSDVNEVIDRTHLPSTLVYDDDLAEALEGYVSGSDLSTALQPYLTKTEAAETYATKDSLKDYVTLATAQTITGKKTFSADAVFAAKLYVPSSAGAGVYDVFIDDTGAVSGETPSAGGGLDEDELWSILSAQTSDVNEVIDRTHLPSTLVYDDDLAEALEGYVSQTELSTALQPYLTKTEAAETYATKDSLKDYVTLATAQTITGKKTFSADAVFAAKLYVPSSAGAGVYDVCIDDSGAVSGETPSAEGEGLDIDAMWNELAADDASRAIHLSHIPLIPWANVSGKPMTLQGYGLLTEADNRYVRQVTGMGLSSNDYTDGEKEKLSGIAAGAQVNVLESVKLNGSLLQITSKAVNVNAVTSLSVPTGLSAGDMTSAGKISVSLASGYVIPKNTAKFWGRTWNGLADVSGAIEGATDIDASGTVYAATAIRTNKLYVPSTSGNNVYDIYVDDSGAVSGETPAAGEGLDIDAMWAELATDDASRTIHLSHIPSIPTSKITGLGTVLVPYATQTWVQQQGYLTPSNYASTLDSRYMQDGANLGGKAYLRYVGINGGKYNFLTNVANSTDPFMVYAPTTAGVSGQWLKSTGGTPTWANDGSGSGLDADLLDGVHASGLLTALTSNTTTNLSLTVGGTVKSVADLYATYLEGQTLAGTRRGMSFLTSSFSAAGWYRVFTSADSNVVYTNEVLLHIGRNYASPQNEHYSFSICVGYNGDISITQLSGVMGGHLITKIRVVWDNSQKFYIDVYVTGASNGYSNTYGVTGQGWGTFSAFTSGASIPDGYTAYEFTTVDGCKSDRGFSGTLSGNATSATKLQTSRTLWGQSFDGTGNVSGDMTGVGNITASGNITTVNGLFRINVTNIAADRGLDMYYSDRRLFCGFGNSGNYGIYTEATGWAMSIHGTYIAIANSSASNVGIGTTSPAYKLDVAGTLRATGDIWTGGKLYIPSTAGNNVYDIFLDDTGAVSGEVPGIDSLDKITDLDPSWQPVLQGEPALLFAGRVSSTGTVTKYAGTGTLSCTRSATGIYALTLKDDSQSAVSLYNCCVTATALYTSSTSAAYICTTNYVSSVYSVKISNLASGALANCAFNIVIFK